MKMKYALTTVLFLEALKMIEILLYYKWFAKMIAEPPGQITIFTSLFSLLRGREKYPFYVISPSTRRLVYFSVPF